MNESGATAWEIREMARKINNAGVCGLVDLEKYDIQGCLVPDLMRDAILVEALTLLAATRERERSA